MDLIVEAFSKTDRQLVVIGDGPEFNKVKAKAGPNVQILGYQPHSVLLDHMQRAKGFVFAAEEDFGIIPVEAQSCGTPVIAYGRGGALETVTSETGVFFDEQTPESLIAAMDKFERLRFYPHRCRANAERFSNERWRREYTEFVTKAWREFQKNKPRIRASVQPVPRQEP
jgi:glycosyltransferase involved in cell wall biosynthesis